MTTGRAEGRALRAAIYCRISLARDDDTKGVDRQERDCRALAHRRGWEVVAVHVDNSRSAWQRNRKRPGWDALLHGIEHGDWDAVVVYHGDRLIRQSRDLEDLLDLARDKGIRLASILGDRDLDNPDDQYILRIEAAGATRESDNTSRRTKRAYKDKAAAGLPHATGRRAFGYQRDGLTKHPTEAPILVELAERLLAGESVLGLCRDLHDRGITTTTGGPWTHGTLRKMLARARYAGLREHHGKVVGDATWPPLLDRDTWEAVRSILEHRAATFGYTTNARRYLLTGIALCGSCQQPLVIRHNTRSESLRGYGCTNPACQRKVHRSVAHLDDFVSRAAVKLLADPRLVAGLAEPRTKGPGVGSQITALEQRRRAAIRDFARSTVLTQADLEDTVREIDAQLAALRERLAGQSAGHVLSGLAGIDLEGWHALPLSRRRAVVTVLMRVTVLPSGRRGPKFDPEAVHLEPLLPTRRPAPRPPSAGPDARGRRVATT